MKNWAPHIVVIGLTILLFSAALILHGKDALAGITWGAKDLGCTINEGNCTIDMQKVPVKLGVYDPQNEFTNSDKFGVDHYFISWINFDKSTLLTDLEKSSSRNRWPMVSVEPWNSADSNRETLLKDISKGEYDQNIKQVCSTFAQYNKPLFIRFGHEMEKVTGRYPWAVNNSDDYKSAYRHFVTECKSQYSQGYYAWSPAGDKGLENYYPGDDVVDYVGLSIYGLEQFDKDFYGHFRSFSENINEKYERVKQYKKPVMIAELGIAGTKNTQKSWLKEGLENAQKFPQLKLVVYFNFKDHAGVWGENYGIPDWTLDNSIFN